MYKFFILPFLCFFALNAHAQIETNTFLLYPQNEQIVEETTPTFSWTQSGARTYALRVVELLENQVAEEGFHSNQSFFYIGGVRFGSLLYPLGAKPFETGKKYAWAVLASKENNGSVLVSEAGGEAAGTAVQFDGSEWSEIYVFQYKGEKNGVSCVAILRENITESFYALKKQQIVFSFPDAPLIEVKDYTYRLLTEDKQGIENFHRKIVPIFERDGIGVVELRQYQFFREKENMGKIFLLEAKSKDGRTYYVKFKNN